MTSQPQVGLKTHGLDILLTTPFGPHVGKMEESQTWTCCTCSLEQHLKNLLNNILHTYNIPICINLMCFLVFGIPDNRGQRHVSVFQSSVNYALNYA